MTTMNEDDGMDPEVYGDGPKKSAGSVDEQEAESPAALIPKSLLGGKKFEPGDEVVLEIVAEHGDQVEVKYASEKPEEHDKSMHESGGESGADPELAEMDKNY